MTNIHDFIHVLDSCIDEAFPDTVRYILAGGDFIKDVVMELREGEKRLRYSPYELFNESEDYEETIMRFVDTWKEVLDNDD